MLDKMSLSSAVAPSLILIVGYVFAQLVIRRRRSLHATDVNGPPRSSFLMGSWNDIAFGKNLLPVFSKWNKKYGGVVSVWMPLGGKRLILYDPKAIINYFSKDTYEIQHGGIQKRFLKDMSGRSLIWAEGDAHKSQRRTMNPAFSNVVIRDVTPVFFESVYKMKDMWDQLIESDHQVIDVQTWMNRLTLDIIGLAGFSHEFKSLDGVDSAVSKVFEAINSGERSPLGKLVASLTVVFPALTPLFPTKQRRLLLAQNYACGEMADELMARAKSTDAGLSGHDDRSLMGVLLKAEAGTHLTKEEVRDQIKLLLIAGYETTAVALTWALIELALNPDIQDRLRHELCTHYPTSDPTFDELWRELPYLDGVIQETLRLHPPVHDVWREAAKDNVLPLSEPIRTRSGELTDKIYVSKGTWITVPVQWLQRSPALWGPDADEFKPERWFDTNGRLPDGARELQGHRHLLAFIDGPRACLGKNFAIAELKAAISVLIRNYTFELPDGPNTKLGWQQAIVRRPKVEGERGCAVPMIVRKVE